MLPSRGTIDAISYLADEAQHSPDTSLLFLTPCHATTLYSHLHRPLVARFLDCSSKGWAPAVACLNGGYPAGGGVVTARAGESLWGMKWGDSLNDRMQRRVDEAQMAAKRDISMGRCLAEATAQRLELLGGVGSHQMFENESDRFSQNPRHWLEAEYPADNRTVLPTHIVMFDNMQQHVDGWLQQSRYRLRTSFFHSHFAVDRGHDARVQIYSRDDF